MNQTFLYLTIGLIVISVAMVLIILVQRPQGGGLASAFGGGGGNDTVFGGRVGDALTVMTVITFILFLGFAVALNLVESKGVAQIQPVTEVTAPATANTASSGVSPSNTTQSKPDHPTGNSKPDHPAGNTNPDHPTSGGSK